MKKNYFVNHYLLKNVDIFPMIASFIPTTFIFKGSKAMKTIGEAGMGTPPYVNSISCGPAFFGLILRSNPVLEFPAIVKGTLAFPGAK